jgi:hypothetical protein
MEMTKILAELDAEIGRLQQAKALLSGTEIKRSPGGSKGAVTTVAKKKRNLSPEARARIAAAVKARWAKRKKAAK